MGESHREPGDAPVVHYEQIRDELKKLMTELSIVRMRFDILASVLPQGEIAFTRYLYEMFLMQMGLLQADLPPTRSMTGTEDG